MAKASRSDAVPEAAVRAAIEYAERYAGDDDEKFVEALNLHVHTPARKAGGERARIPLPVNQPATRSFQIFKDPRYLANARELARRTLGGVRVIGGAPVKAGDSIQVTLTVKQITPRSSADYGEVRWDALVVNGDGKLVATYDVLTLVAKQDTGEA